MQRKGCKAVTCKLESRLLVLADVRTQSVTRSSRDASSRGKFNKFTVTVLPPAAIVRRAPTRYHMIRHDDGNKGTFNESGYICSGQSIVPWCTPRSFPSPLRFSCYGWHERAPRVKKGTKRFRKMQSREETCRGFREFRGTSTSNFRRFFAGVPPAMCFSWLLSAAWQAAGP